MVYFFKSRVDSAVMVSVKRVVYPSTFFPLLESFLLLCRFFLMTKAIGDDNKYHRHAAEVKVMITEVESLFINMLSLHFLRTKNKIVLFT